MCKTLETTHKLHFHLDIFPPQTILCVGKPQHRGFLDLRLLAVRVSQEHRI